MTNRRIGRISRSRNCQGGSGDAAGGTDRTHRLRELCTQSKVVGDGLATLASKLV